MLFRSISGWVRDTNGEALPGATITIRGSKHGAIAGLDGQYTFNIPAQEGLILTYSFIGMEKKTVKYTGKKTINVTLNSSTSTEIDEVVVTGYQNIQRRDKGIQAGNMKNVYIYGGVMIVLAFVSLFCGVQAGKYAASASTGFACNLREGIYTNLSDTIRQRLVSKQ